MKNMNRITLRAIIPCCIDNTQISYHLESSIDIKRKGWNVDELKTISVGLSIIENWSYEITLKVENTRKG